MRFRVGRIIFKLRCFRGVSRTLGDSSVAAVRRATLRCHCAVFSKTSPPSEVWFPRKGRRKSCDSRKPSPGPGASPAGRALASTTSPVPVCLRSPSSTRRSFRPQHCRRTSQIRARWSSGAWIMRNNNIMNIVVGSACFYVRNNNLFILNYIACTLPSCIRRQLYRFLFCNYYFFIKNKASTTRPLAYGCYTYQWIRIILNYDYKLY